MKLAIEARHHRLNPSLFPLEMMIEESIEFLRKNEPPEGYFVGFSGGKDSIVTERLCRMAGVKHRSFYSITGIDPPETTVFIKREYPSVIRLKPPMSFWEGILKKSPPLRRQRWCCDVLKKQPANPKVIKRLVGDPLRNRVMGIRAEESNKRASRPRIDKWKGIITFKPIFYWKEWHIWEFIDLYDLKYPCLYDEGFHRIGCIVCPYIVGPGVAAQKRIQRAKDRWPNTFNKFEKVVSEWFMARWKNSTRKQIQKTPEEYLEAYYRGFE